MNQTVQPVELAISAIKPPPLEWIDGTVEERSTRWREVLGDPGLARWLGGFRPTHLYVGSEFCEHLLPSEPMLRRAVRTAHTHHLQPVLVTPVASPKVIDLLPALLRLLPNSAEVVVNDWGVGRLVAREFPGLQLTAGRILCRMIKDPRLPNADWAPQCGYGFDSRPMQALFARLNLVRLEMDTPMFPDGDSFSRLPLPKGVHLPYSYVAKGRMCRIGSMSMPDTERFSVGRPCRKECLKFSGTTTRPGTSDRQDTLHVGNTVFSRHSKEMLEAVIQTTARGGIERLIAPGARL